MGIGGRIRSLRKAANLTQEEFADRLRISKGFLSNLEKGIRQPSNQLIKLISYEYSSSEYWLNTGQGDMYLSPEEIMINQKARLGERAFVETFKKIMADQSLVIPMTTLGAPGGNNDDPDLDRMIKFLLELWSIGDEKLRSWAIVQFDRAFPADVQEEVKKNRTKEQDRKSAG